MNTVRSNRPEVRNPMLALPEVLAFMDLPLDAQVALRGALIACSKACRAKGDEAWRKHKPPLAAYWKANAVNARHLALAMPTRAAPKTKRSQDPTRKEFS